MAFNKIASLRLFKNDVDPNSNRPVYSNSKWRVEQAIPAGEYSVAQWKPNDDGSLSITIEVKTDGVGSGNGFVQPTPPGPLKGGADDFDSI